MSTSIPALSRAALAVVLSIAFSIPAAAQVQDKGQQKCLGGLGKGAAGVARNQGKENLACLLLAGKGETLPGGSAQACVSADPKQKVAAAMAKTVAVDAASCTPVPDFGYQLPSVVNDAARSEQVSLLGDVFGANLDAAAVACGTDKAACGCQSSVLKAIEASAAARFKTYLGCKKAALAGGADAVTNLAACVSDAGTPGSIAADTKGTLGKSDAKLEDAVAAKCPATPAAADALFPGACAGQGGGSLLAKCVESRVECRVCETLNSAEGLGVDCDMFDDGLSNASCVNFSGDTFVSVAAGKYVGADPMTLQLGATDVYAASPLNYFSLEVDAGVTKILSTGNDKYLRVDPMDSLVYADAADAASGTSWVLFVEAGSDPLSLIILRDGPAGINVDALEFDGASGKLKVVTVDVSTAVTEPRFKFLMY